MREAENRLQKLRRPVEQVSKTAEQVEEATKMGDSKTTEVVVKGPSLTERLFGTTQTILGTLVEMIILLYFLLAAGDLFLQKLIKVLPQLRDKKKAVAIARETEASISTYLVTVTLRQYRPWHWRGGGDVPARNAEPDPLGSAGCLRSSSSHTWARQRCWRCWVSSAWSPSTRWAMRCWFRRPTSRSTCSSRSSSLRCILGERLTLNPVAIFIGLVFWWWIWGVPGAFIAVPLIATFKIFCDHIEALAPIGEFLGR